MPTENEFKYVLCPDADEEVFRSATDSFIEIEQAYLVHHGNTTVRIRKSDRPSWASSQYELCLKEKTNRVIEIETEIDERDFQDLWELSTNKLKKTRYDLGDGWIVDFFKDGGNVYFAMAECEVEENIVTPPDPIDAISDKMIYSGISGADSRFSSRKLSCPVYAKKVLQDIENVKKYLTQASQQTKMAP